LAQCSNTKDRRRRYQERIQVGASAARSNLTLLPKGWIGRPGRACGSSLPPCARPAPAPQHGPADDL